MTIESGKRRGFWGTPSRMFLNNNNKTEVYIIIYKLNNLLTATQIKWSGPMDMPGLR